MDPTAISGGELLLDAPYFRVENYTLTGERSFEQDGRSAHVLVALDGAGSIETAAQEDLAFARGAAVIVPASMATVRIRPTPTLTLVRASLP